MSFPGSRRLSNPVVPWRLRLAILAIVFSSGSCRSTGDGFGASDGFSSSSSSSLPRKSFDQEIGSPSELAWQAWLLVENKSGGQSPLDSSNILRRITPKSIFIAPELVACPSGYSSDGKGVCKPDPIKIDEDAQRQFFLGRLNALYGKFGNSKKKPEAQGPLQINIPISLPPKPEPQPPPPPPQQVVEQKPIVTENRLAIPVVISQPQQQQQQSSKQEAVTVVVYQVAANETKKPTTDSPREEGSYLFGHSNSSDHPKKATAQVVQVAEILDELNETFSGVVDYKIPIGLKPILNRSGDFEQTKTGPGDAVDQTEKSESSEDSSPTVVLLLSPTQLPTQPSSSSTTEIDVETEADENTGTLQTTAEDDGRSTIQTVAPLEVGGTTKSTSTERSYVTQEDETVYADEEESQTEDSEDHEDYDDTTAEDEFAESEDELLKPGEAGMMIPSKNQDLVKFNSQKQQQRPSTLSDEATSTTFLDTTTIEPTLPTAAEPQDAYDAAESTFKSEELAPTTQTTTEIPSTMASTETTLYLTSPLRTKIPMRAATPTPAPPATTSLELDETRQTFETERDLVTEPEVVFSTQNSGGRKRPTHYSPELLDERTELPATNNDSPYRRQKPTITVNDEPILFKNDGDIPLDFKDQMADSSKPLDSKQRVSFGVNDESYVRFPEQTPESGSSRLIGGGYVRFPSDEVNSIHSPDGYNKEHLLSPYRSRDGEFSSATSTKSSVPARQRSPSTRWRIPSTGGGPAVRMDRQQQQQQQQRQQKQKPMLLRFWARMPLVRDLSFYPTTSHGSHNEPIGGDRPERQNSRFSTAQPRRVNHYKEMSTHDVNRLLAQQLNQPAIGG